METTFVKTLLELAFRAMLTTSTSPQKLGDYFLLHDDQQMNYDAGREDFKRPLQANYRTADHIDDTLLFPFVIEQWVKP